MNALLKQIDGVTGSPSWAERRQGPALPFGAPSMSDAIKFERASTHLHDQMLCLHSNAKERQCASLFAFEDAVEGGRFSGCKFSLTCRFCTHECLSPSLPPQCYTVPHRCTLGRRSRKPCKSAPQICTLILLTAGGFALKHLEEQYQMRRSSRQESGSLDIFAPWGAAVNCSGASGNKD